MLNPVRVSMALGSEGASSSNSSFNSAPQWKYHVFLSFRGETRTNFSDFLYTTLVRKGILTFRDEEQLERGEVISKQLHEAIEESLSAIVVLSPKYATSAWCLNELQIIVESRKMLEGLVFPVFYDVEPSDVRYQKGSFAEAFRKHEERYKEDTQKVERWRQALRKVADLSGYPSKDRHQSQLIEEIVAELWTKLQRKLPSHNDGLVGIHSRMEKMLSLLGKDVCFIGIWGMGGIGKTTLARIVYETIRNKFEISCFLANVREISGERGHGLVKLQRELLSHLKIRGLEIEDSFDGKKQIRNLLFNKKVLLVLDDISANSQLENLGGNQNWFGQESRVIITTRDKQLLISHGVSEMYPMQILNRGESLELFCQKAFKDEPEQFYLELSENVIQYAGGLPLALKVLGSFLCGRSVPEWKNALDEIKQFPPEDIISILRISYKALDDNRKDIFLNIACFFKGMSKREVTHILDVCGLFPIIGINVLLERSLLTEYLEDGKWRLGMHDLLQEMGKRIVNHESLDDVEKRSRLWLQEDIDDVLTKNKGTELIRSIVLNPSRSYEARWDPEAFLKMQNIKLLMLENLNLPLGLNCLSKELKFLKWKQFPLEELPLGVQLDKLVELTMRESKMKQLWQGEKQFGKLKIIDLTNSKDLILFPSVSEVPCLDSLVLKRCINLVEVHYSVGVHKKLRLLNLRDCMNLEILPSKLEMDTLEVFILSGCSKVQELPEFGDNMENLSKLNLKGCKSLVCLPRSIDNLKALRILDTSDCSKLSTLPENLDKFEGLEELDVRGTAIKDVPSTIVHLKFLKKLSLGGQRETESNSCNLLGLPFQLIMMLPALSSFSLLKELDLSYRNLSDESLPVDLGCLPLLWNLDLSGNNFINLPASSFANLSKLYNLKLNDCPMLKSIPMLPPEVDRLSARNCHSWEPLSDPQYLCDYFASYPEVRYDYYHFLVIPGSEIPPWFNNQSYFHEEIDSSFHWEVILGSDFIYDPSMPLENEVLISIIVDIPDYCLSSEGWGIAICLVFENPFPPFPWLVPTLTWICKTPKIEEPTPSGFPVTSWIEEFSDPHLCILLLRGDDANIQRHLKGGHNQIQLLFYAPAIAMWKDASRGPLYDTMNISKCGCRVISKEDLQVWGKATSKRNQSNNFDTPSSSLNKSRESEIPSSSHNKSRATDIGDENPSCDGSEMTFIDVSNAEAI